MATDAKTELTNTELLHYYVGMRLEKGDRKVPIQQILADFPVYLRQRDAMREMIAEATNSIDTAGSQSLDLEQAINEVIRDLAAMGVTE